MKKGRLEQKERPPVKTVICFFSMFTVLTADMLKKGCPCGKHGKNKYRFYRGYDRRKRGAPLGKTGNNNMFLIFTVFSAQMHRINPVTPATTLNQHSSLPH